MGESRRRRLVERIYIPLPEEALRVRLLQASLQADPDTRMNLDPEALTDVASATEGYSCSDLKALCREAALLAVRCMQLQTTPPPPPPISAPFLAIGPAQTVA